MPSRSKGRPPNAFGCHVVWPCSWIRPPISASAEIVLNIIASSLRAGWEPNQILPTCCWEHAAASTNFWRSITGDVARSHRGGQRQKEPQIPTVSVCRSGVEIDDEHWLLST